MGEILQSTYIKTNAPEITLKKKNRFSSLYYFHFLLFFFSFFTKIKEEKELSILF